MDNNFYRQFSHDILNITGRLESATSLLDPDDPPAADDLALARRLIEQDSQKLNHAIRLFCLIAWLQSSPPHEQSQVDFAVLLQEVTNRYVRDGATPVVLDLQDDNCHIKSQQDVLRPLLGELIKNAVIHSAASTAVDVKASWNETHVAIEITNTPLEPMPENPEQPLNARPDTPGMGLGLPFAFQAAQHLGGHLEVIQKNNLVKTKLTL
mgnify:CR=1 FL=1